jgi:hypothetical protein
MKLGVLARTSQNPTSLLSALWIFLWRFWSPEIARGPRKSSYESVFIHLLSCAISYSCSRRHWSLFIGFFIALATLGPMLPFLLGRIMDIETFVCVRITVLPLSLAFLSFEQNQHMVYSEVLIAGDLSQEDVDRATAQLGAFQVSQAVVLRSHVPTVSRVLPRRGPCSRMAQASQITSSSLTATKQCISPNQVSHNSSLAVLGLVISMSIELRH